MSKLLINLSKHEKGTSLIEVIVAIGLIGVIATAFFMAFFIATKSIALADERTTAESLARTQIEFVKRQIYIPETLTSTAEYLETGLSENPRYSISSLDHRTDTIVEDIIATPWDSNVDVPEDQGDDYGLQKITLIIFHDNNEVLRLEGYKVDEGVY
jgi:prepilin-type N-terminal cleavage/methylation domain-containing protein